MNKVSKKYAELLHALIENGGAECEQVPNVFFPEDNAANNPEFHQSLALARQICARCPILDTCRDYALAANEPYGVWGGLYHGK